MNLVERLRTYQENISGDMIPIYETPDVCIEAADRIEELESTVSNQLAIIANQSVVRESYYEKLKIAKEALDDVEGMNAPFASTRVRQALSAMSEDNSPVPD